MKLASIIAGFMSAILEFDEIKAETIGDEIEYTILTTGIRPEACEIKTLIWSYLAPPVKRLKVVSIEEVEAGPITKRYKIVVRGKKFLGGLRPSRW